MLKDSLDYDNSIGCFLTETWLSQDILDAEVNLEGYNLFRGDRIGRTRGGAAIYLKERLNGRLSKAFSNGVVDCVVATSKVLDSVFVSLYRPPDTKLQEWKCALETLSSELELLQANGMYQRILLGGDLNFRDLQWNSDGEMCISNDLGKQQEELFLFCSRFLLSNLVDKPTRGSNLLDVILSND